MHWTFLIAQPHCNMIHGVYQLHHYYNDGKPYKGCDMAWCEGCRHFSPDRHLTPGVCMYVVDMSMKRDCPAGKGCTHKVEQQRKDYVAQLGIIKIQLAQVDGVLYRER